MRVLDAGGGDAMVLRRSRGRPSGSGPLPGCASDWWNGMWMLKPQLAYDMAIFDLPTAHPGAGAPNSEIPAARHARHHMPADCAVGSIDPDISAMPAWIAAVSPDGDG